MKRFKIIVSCGNHKNFAIKNSMPDGRHVNFELQNFSATAEFPNRYNIEEQILKVKQQCEDHKNSLQDLTIRFAYKSAYLYIKDFIPFENFTHIIFLDCNFYDVFKSDQKKSKFPNLKSLKLQRSNIGVIRAFEHAEVSAIKTTVAN